MDVVACREQEGERAQNLHGVIGAGDRQHNVVAACPTATISTQLAGFAASGATAARTCYDHLAGQLGVSIADGLMRDGYVELAGDAGIVTEAGIARLAAIGMDVRGILERRTKHSGRILCRPCLDWSERRPHLAGMIGALICEHSMQQGWTRRLPATRAVQLAPEGERAFREGFGAQLV